MAFAHKSQKEFYSDYAIKNGMNISEQILNLFGVRLKKETTDIYNRFQVTNGLKPLEWRASEEYEMNEIVQYDFKVFKCLQDCIGKEPAGEPDFWKEVTMHEFTKFPMDNYLAKDNQTPYNPSELRPNEERIDYHPATVKHVEERLRYWFDNETVANADRLDGEHGDYYCTKEEFDQHIRKTINVDDIVDNLESDSRLTPLSAYQGKKLQQQIQKINEFLSSDDVELDELQEIVNWVKANREAVDSLSIDNIKGLREHLNTVKEESDNKVTQDFWDTNFITKLREVDGHRSGVDADLLDGYHADYFLPREEFNPAKITEIINRLPPAVGRIDAIRLNGLGSEDFLRRSTSDTPTRDATFELGSSSRRWNNIYAVNFQGTALRARYADLAEIYDLKANFEMGYAIGYNRISKKYRYFEEGDIFFGVVSDKPGFILNKDSEGTLIALKGQTPVRTLSEIEEGDYILADIKNAGYCIGVKDYNFEESKRLIGIALEDSKDGFVKVKI